MDNSKSRTVIGEGWQNCEAEKAILAAIPHAAWIKDANKLFVFVNPAYEKISGHPASDILGRNACEIWGESAGTRMQEADDWVIEKKRPLHKEDSFIIDGAQVWMEIHRSPVFDKVGKITAIVGIGSDVSQRKKLEGELAAALDTALEARHMASLGIMAAGITHELNQPLQAIKLSADSIVYWFERRKTFEPEAIMKALGLISRNAERINRIINRVRTFVKSRQEIAEIQPVDLNQAVSDGLEMLDHQLRSHGVEMKVFLEAGLPLVSGNITQLEEVVINLVTNARQSLDLTEKSDKWIEVRTEVVDEDVVLSIADNGAGFSEDAKKNMFRPFFTTKTEGLGLGLSIVHSIVTGFSGHIEAISDVVRKCTVLKITLKAWPKSKHRTWGGERYGGD